MGVSKPYKMHDDDGASEHQGCAKYELILSHTAIQFSVRSWLLAMLLVGTRTWPSTRSRK